MESKSENLLLTVNRAIFGNSPNRCTDHFMNKFKITIWTRIPAETRQKAFVVS